MPDTSPFRLLVAGGGTGGHVFPALTTIRVLRKRFAESGCGIEVLWLGQADGLEARTADREQIPFAPVAVGKIRRDRNPLKMLSRANATDMARVPLGIAQARREVARFQPDTVLTTGGYVSIPSGIAARICRRPLVIHEQTVRLGLANRVLGRLADRIALSSESSLTLLPAKLRTRAVVTGNPVRPEIFTGQPDKAIDALGLHTFDRSLPTILVTGGAQGAQQINTTVRQILPWLLLHANVIHQCGTASAAELREFSTTLESPLAQRYSVTEFIAEEMPDVLALADLVICRSGAGTIAELTAIGKPAILIPLASAAGNEQAHNAAQLEITGAAVSLATDVSPQTLRTALASLLDEPERRAAMAERARQHGRPNAAERLAEELLTTAMPSRDQQR
ncbi:undecaprenyldiphospho-muramoylpentapeptide beta-N-acetylglucosaminyltransferase [Nocardia sp. NPDC003482]